ncbi:hypothetical protein O164_01625 [Pseudomonas taiwanensis SJ9]|uniref:Uncharacterized protein n=1 Tax=Pseudomonas taiwanensis SJ9 TaxID=1388762 RepID=V7DI76_9PSED|nr:hypothetical protein O164_01625 [Pseudomonas taiwanensis SJ9]
MYRESQQACKLKQAMMESATFFPQYRTITTLFYILI